MFQMINKRTGSPYVDWDFKPKYFATREEAMNEFEGDPLNDQSPATDAEVAEWEIVEI